MKVNMTGMKALIDAADKNKKVGDYLAQALTASGNEVLRESKKIVPYDTRALQASGRVERPVRYKGFASLEITYGGPAAPYALYVHEDPNARHKPGRTYKYLEKPMLAAQPQFVMRVKQYFATYLKRGGR